MAEQRGKLHFFVRRSGGGIPCAKCGLHQLDPQHLRANGRNNGRRPLISKRDLAAVNAVRATYGMEPVR